MKLRGPQIALLVSLLALTGAGYWGLVYIVKRNLPQLRVVLARDSLPTAAVQTAMPLPTAVPTSSATPTAAPTPTPTPPLPQTRYDQQIATSPNDAALRVLRGDAYLELRAYEWARADFQVAAELDPGLAEAYLGRGKALFYLKEWDAALGDFDRARVLRPDLADAHAWRGYLLAQQRDMLAAVEALQQAVWLDSTDPLKHTWLAEALWRSRRAGEAEGEASLALALDERCTEASVARAIALAEMGDVDGAQAELDTALAFAPYAPAAFDAQARLFAWYRGDHLAEAERLARRALAGAQDDFERAAYLDTLAWALHRMGRSSEALAALDEAAQLTTVDGRVAYAEILAHRELVRAKAQ